MKKKYLISLFALLLITTACDTNTLDDLIDPVPEPEPEEVISYNQDIKPIVDNRCIVCHAPGGVASFAPLTNYQEVSARIEAVLGRIQLPSSDPRAMPPGGPQLPQNQINLFLAWRDEGLIESE